MTDDIRSQLHWLRTQQRADALIAADKALAARIERAAKKARGVLVDEPTDPTARAIIAAGRKRRCEGEFK